MKALTLSLGIKCFCLTECVLSYGKKPLILREEIRILSEKGPPFFISTQEIKKQLQEIIQLWKLSPGPIEVILSSDLIFLHFATLGTLPSKNIFSKRFFHQEAERFIPLPLEKITWRYLTLFLNRRDSTTLLYGAIKKDFLIALTNITSEINFKISAVTTTPWSFYPLLAKKFRSKEALLIDIGHHSITLLFLPIKATPHYLNFFYPSTFKQKLESDMFFSFEQKAYLKKIITDFLSSLNKDSISVLVVGEAASGLAFFLKEDFLPSVALLTCYQKNYGSIISYKEVYLEEVGAQRGYSIRSYSLLKNAKHFVFSYLILDWKQNFLLISFISSLLLSLLLLGSSFYYHRTSESLLHKILQEELLLNQRKADFKVLEKKVKEQEEEKNLLEEAHELQKAHDYWALLLQDLQEHLPPRYLWITVLSPVTTAIASPTNNEDHLHTVVALEIKGLYLENSKNAEVVDDFVNNLQHSDYFSLPQINLEKVLIQRATADGTAYAYPFTLHLPLKKALLLNDLL